MLDFLKDTTATGLWCMFLVSSGAILFVGLLSSRLLDEAKQYTESLG